MLVGCDQSLAISASDGDDMFHGTVAEQRAW